MSPTELVSETDHSMALRRRDRRAKTGVAVLLIVSLVAQCVTRDLAISTKEAIHSEDRAMGSGPAPSDTSLSNMPAFATALLLGGLRGPLVMILWTSSETQKQQHDLQDFDTKVEWIRLLQPEFDTVHLFEIWNKAYNISVQMASLRNKYTTILDAIDYAQKVENTRPDDINIITAVASIYGDKLGTSQEHVYYRARVRRETQTLVRVSFPKSREEEFRQIAPRAGWIEDESPLIPNERTQMVQALLERAQAQQLAGLFGGSDVTYSAETRRETQRTDPDFRRVRLDPMLDEQGNILRPLLVPRYPRPANLGADQPWYDGSELQCLAGYQPFPYGLSTLALSFNYYKRAQLLQTLWNEHHIQSGDTVVDARPALTLKDWAKDEWERGRREELRMCGLAIPESVDPIELEGPTAKVDFARTSPDDPAREAAIYSYGLAARLYSDARSELRRHIELFTNYAGVYFVHIDDTLSGEQMMIGDRDFMAAGIASGPERKELLQKAGDAYRAARLRYAITVLKYYVDDPVMSRVFPRDPKTGQQYNRVTIESSDPGKWLDILEAAKNANEEYFKDPNSGQYMQSRDTYHDDRENYLKYIDRCADRLEGIEAATTEP